MDETTITKYLNTQAVKDALHVRSSKLANPWSVCTSHINYARSWPSVVPIYPDIIAATHKVMVYSGDVTFNCGFLGSERWIHDKLKMPVSERWRNWLVDGQVGGYATGYGANNRTSFRFVTVRNAGHMVPQYQPVRAFHLLQNYLKWQF
jgi:carboxypeptidase C (cathepsin A)